MTLQEEVARRIAGDPLLARLRRKIDGKNADFKDTAAYSNRAADIMSEIFARRLPELSLAEREALCVELLRDRHTDINGLLSRVQLALDDAAGIHIAPQHAPFNSERAHQIGRSTADPTVSEETQQRRARSAPATAARAMHDDYIRKNADFRSNAGLKCYINREAVPGCCAWCTAMTGRFEYGEEPDDIYRRHDNCSCSVTYENGRKRQDVWSKRTWEAPDKDAGAPEPTVFTPETAPVGFVPTVISPEQARKLQEKHQLKRLTKSAESGTMRLADSDDSWHPITEASIQAIPSISAFPEKVNSAIEQHCRELLSSLIDDKMGTEGTVSICLRDLTSKSAKGEQGVGTVSPIKLDEPFISIHNHPSNKSFSELDLSHFVTTENMAGMCVVGNSGKNVYILKKAEGFNWLEFWNKVLPIQKSADFVKLVLKEAKKYGFEYYEIANR